MNRRPAQRRKTSPATGEAERFSARPTFWTTSPIQAEHLLQIARMADKTGGDARLSVVKDTLMEYATQTKGRNTT